jgi:2-oxo-4-hydroxy-4-carboxy-5-ureidoimidazoline decarboxylase
MEGRNTRLASWNAIPAADAVAQLLACCASPAWARTVVEGRPYGSVEALLLTATDVLGRLPWAEVEKALQAHPRIGERLAAATRESDWSRQEQAGAARTDDRTGTALIEINRAYEERFGHVFLIFATGRTAHEMLAAARERLANDESTERVVVRHELAKITRLRIERLLES